MEVAATTSAAAMPKPSLEERGILYLSGVLDATKAETLCKSIIDLNMKGGIDHIQLFITCPGGEVDAMFAITDLMEWSKLPVYTIGLGQIGSGGLIVFMTGEKRHRVITPRVSILSHRYNWWAFGNHSDLVARRKEEDLTHQRIVDHYLRHTKIKTVKKLHQVLLRDVDTWLTAQEAVKWGIADKIEGKALVSLKGSK